MISENGSTSEILLITGCAGVVSFSLFLGLIVVYVCISNRRARRGRITSAEHPDVLSEEDPPSLIALYRELLVTTEWRPALNKLSATLPTLVQCAATAQRTGADITLDILNVVARALRVDFSGIEELRTEQADTSVKEVWVASYPFLDLVPETQRGMYESTRDKIREGCTFVFFQKDRAYFDPFVATLKNDASLSGVDIDAAVSCVIYDDALQYLSFAVWNPHGPSMTVLRNVGDPISVQQRADGQWSAVAAPTMEPVTNQEFATLLRKRLAEARWGARHTIANSETRNEFTL